MGHEIVNPQNQTQARGAMCSGATHQSAVAGSEGIVLDWRL